jgi:hypothetical protein
MKTIYTQQEVAEILKFNNYRSLNRLVSDGKLECIKRSGRAGNFSRKSI